MKGCLNGMLGAAKMTELVGEAYAGLGASPSRSNAARYGKGVQMFLPGARTAKELRADRRRAARQMGLFKLERESPSVQVGNRRLKAWRVPGTAQFVEHARIVARLAEEFAGVDGAILLHDAPDVD